MQNARNQGQLGNIAHNMSLPHAPDTTPPMDVIYKPPLSETYQGLLASQRERELGLKENLGYGRLGQGEEKIRQAGELGKEKLRQGQEGVDIKNKQLDVNAFKAMHPGMKFQISKGGNIFGLDPISGKAVDTGIDSGTLSDEDKQNLIGERQISNIRARGTEQRTSEDTRQEGRLGAIAARGAQSRETNAARSDVRMLLPTQERVRQSSGIPQNSAPVGSPEFDMINERLYGKAKDINLPSEKGKKPSSKNNDPLGICK